MPNEEKPINRYQRINCLTGYILKHLDEEIKPLRRTPDIKKVIFNPPATIILWDDGTKTVVKCQGDDKFDPEKGIAMAVAKKYFGNKGSYCNQIKPWLKEWGTLEDSFQRIDSTIKSAETAGLSYWIAVKHTRHVDGWNVLSLSHFECSNCKGPISPIQEPGACCPYCKAVMIPGVKHTRIED